MKLWQKTTSKTTNEIIEKFTVGNDRENDILLAPFDILGSMAHAIMLQKINLLSTDELKLILKECRDIFHNEISTGTFKILDSIEDVHSQVEYQLTQKLGDIGKKIHSGRSRNDQVLVDLKMFFRFKIEEITKNCKGLFEVLIEKSDKHKNDLMPGYTHLQIAMPSSFGLWFGAYAESLVDDMGLLLATYKIINKNPLGSGAGYGSSFPLDRQLTTELLGFDYLNYNVIYAQMTRGKMEFSLAQSIANIAQTISRMAMDVCLFNSQNFGFIKLPADMTTGSSIMPHKKNPDVAELLRGKCNALKAKSIEIALIQNNLPSGYHRDFQLIKDIIFPAIDEILDCLNICTYMVRNLEISKDLLDNPKYDAIFSVENVNDLVMNGMPFRDAYIKVGLEFENDNFKPNKELKHTLAGSIGNLCHSEISTLFYKTLSEFNFEKTHQAFEKLLQAEN